MTFEDVKLWQLFPRFAPHSPTGSHPPPPPTPHPFLSFTCCMLNNYICVHAFNIPERLTPALTQREPLKSRYIRGFYRGSRPLLSPFKTGQPGFHLCISGNAFSKSAFQCSLYAFNLVLIPPHRVPVCRRTVCGVLPPCKLPNVMSVGVFEVFLVSMCPSVSTRHSHHLASIHHSPPPSQPCRSHRSFRHPRLRPRAPWRQRYSTAPHVSTGPSA